MGFCSRGEYREVRETGPGSFGEKRTSYKRRFSCEVSRALKVSFTELDMPACRRGESRRQEFRGSHLKCWGDRESGDAVLFSSQETQEGQMGGGGKDQELGIKGAV